MWWLRKIPDILALYSIHTSVSFPFGRPITVTNSSWISETCHAFKFFSALFYSRIFMQIHFMQLMHLTKNMNEISMERIFTFSKKNFSKRTIWCSLPNRTIFVHFNQPLSWYEHRLFPLWELTYQGVRMKTFRPTLAGNPRLQWRHCRGG